MKIFNPIKSKYYWTFWIFKSLYSPMWLISIFMLATSVILYLLFLSFTNIVWVYFCAFFFYCSYLIFTFYIITYFSSLYLSSLKKLSGGCFSIFTSCLAQLLTLHIYNFKIYYLKKKYLVVADTRVVWVVFEDTRSRWIKNLRDRIF